jgi:putative glutamine transport system substrate-binding protein
MTGKLARLAASAFVGAFLLTACATSQTGSSGPAGTGGSGGGPSVAGQGKAPAFAAGSYMETIQKRGMLKAGVKQDVLLYGYLDPRTGKTDGFDVDIAKAIANAIFGDPEKIELTKVTSAQRIPFLQEDQIDVVVATMTITDDRKKEIDFSDVYYLAGQMLLVPKNSTLTKIQDAGGKTICSAKGSTSEVNVPKFAPTAQLLLFDTYTECLTAMQQGRADGLSTDDVILKGLAEQDPNMKLVGEPFTSEPYGIGFKKGHPEFVKFVNDLLADMKKDGRWADIYKKWLGKLGPVPAPPPAS